MATTRQLQTLDEIREALEGAVTTDGYHYIGLDTEEIGAGLVSVRMYFEKVFRLPLTGDYTSLMHAIIFIDEDGRADYIDSRRDGCPTVRIIRRYGRLNLRQALRTWSLDLAA